MSDFFKKIKGLIRGESDKDKKANLDNVSDDTKILIIDAERLMEEVKECMAERNCPFDLTAKLQLKSNFKEIEKNIDLLCCGNDNEKNREKLDGAILRLRTVYEGLMQFYER